MWYHDDFSFFTVIAGEWINITIHITDGKYNKSTLSEEFDVEVTTFMCFFSSSTLVKPKIMYLCVIVMQLCSYKYANQFSCFWLVSSAGC